LFLNGACSLSLRDISATAVTTAAPDSDVFRFFATCVSSFGVDATPAMLALEEVTLTLMRLLVSASDSDSELEDEDSESEDSELEELDSESDEAPSFFGTALTTGFLSDGDSDAELEELDSDPGELDFEPDESPAFFGRTLATGFLLDADSDVESSESESESDSELSSADDFFWGILDLTLGALASIMG
jgi:hypothetical protein